MMKVLAALAAMMLAGAASAAEGGWKAGPAFDHMLPNVPGKSIKAAVVEYAPGQASPAHFHAKSAFITAIVLEGAVRSQVNDGPAKIYHVGESFTENPGDRHSISENASKTEPARLLAIFVVDSADAPLTTPDTKK